MVFQHEGLLPWRSVLDNVAFGLQLQGVGREERRALARQMLAKVGLEGAENRFIWQLSGGQRQRVGIARALAADPEVLLMDEPFGALDPVTRSALQQEMRRIHQLLGRTIVLVTHDIDEALGLAEHLVLMDNGEVVQQGTPLALLTAPRNDFVRDFFGRSELGVRLLSLKQVGEFIEPGMADGAPVAETITLREAMSVFVERQCETLPVVDAGGAHRGVLRFRHLVNQQEARGE